MRDIIRERSITQTSRGTYILVVEIQELLEFDTAVRESAESSLLFHLSRLSGVGDDFVISLDHNITVSLSFHGVSCSELFSPFWGKLEEEGGGEYGCKLTGSFRVRYTARSQIYFTGNSLSFLFLFFKTSFTERSPVFPRD